jgi:hypothetical protein
MKLEIDFNGELNSVVDGDFDFETAYEWIEAHGEAHDWSDEYEYRLTDGEGQVYVFEADSWIEI